MINSEQIQALKAAAEKAIADDWGYDRDEFSEIASPEAIRSLLADRDADKALIAEQAKRIEFLKEQLANFNPDWDKLEAATDSLREHMAELTEANKRIAELEAHKLTVKLPDSIHCPTAPETIWLQTNGDDSEESRWPTSDDDVSWCRDKIFTNDTLYVRADCAAAGIKLQIKE